MGFVCVFDDSRNQIVVARGLALWEPMGLVVFGSVPKMIGADTCGCWRWLKGIVALGLGECG